MDLDAAVREARDRYRRGHPESERLHFVATRVLPGGNTRSVLDFAPFPFRVVATDGPYLVDAEGHRYLDLLGNYSAGLLGHQPQGIADSVKKSVDGGWTTGAVRPAEAEFARLLCERFPSLEQVRLTNSGTEANLMAIATAKHVTGKPGILVFDHAYHGGLLYFGEGGRDLLVPHDWVIATYNDLSSVDEALRRRGSELACILVEPMMASSGCIPGSNEFLQGLRDRASELGALLIFDEVMTSRLSSGGFQLLSGITPDMTTLGKYIAGGMTIGAFGGRSAVMSAFDPASEGTLTHGGTFNNNEVSTAAGIATLGDALTPALIDAVNRRGDRFREGLNELFAASELPMSATGIGSLMNIHGTDVPIESPDDVRAGDDRLKELLFFDLLEKGFYMARRGFIALSVDISDEHIDHAIDAVTDWAEGLSLGR